jgi:hypothetical protein
VSKFSSRSGVEIEAHVCSDAERGMQVKLELGNDTLAAGDALVTLDGKPYVIRAALFAALFDGARARLGLEPDADPESEKETPAAKGKGRGGQHEPPAAGAKR